MLKRIVLLIPLLFLFSSSLHARVIHEEQSLYQNIQITESNSRRCMIFTSVRHAYNQSCQYTAAQDARLVFPYVRMSMAGGLLLDPKPQKILMVGLGGGSIPHALSVLYPTATIDVVEIDPTVVKMAKEYFHFNETDNMHVAVSDARVFVRRAGLAHKHYDLIILDAFSGDYIPEHLMTKEFLQEARNLLTDKGVLVANTFSISKLYDHESTTYQSVFHQFFNVKRPEISANRIIIASKGPLPSRQTLMQRAHKLEKSLEPFGVEITSYPALMSTDIDWDPDARILTDQYSPANLLNE